MNIAGNLKSSMIIACFTIVSSCMMKFSSGNEQPIQIPLNFEMQRPVLQVMIGDKGPYRFIFDTGSSGNVIDSGLAEELGLQVTGTDSLYSPGAEKNLVSKRVNVTQVSFPKTSIIKDSEMSTLDIRKMVDVDGIISAGFFKEYLLTISYAQEKLILYKGELDSTDENVIPFSQSQGIINLIINVEGQEVEAHLDSGNPGEIDLPYVLKDKLNFKERPVEDGAIKTPTVSLKKWKAVLDGQIKTGNIVFENPQVHLVENFPYVNLGARFFRELDITIDKKNSLIKFERVANPAIEHKLKDINGEQNDYTGHYGERHIFLEKGQLYLQRGNAPKLKLEKIKDDLFKMTFSMAVMNELPQVRFERGENKNVSGLTFIFKNGREDFVKKDD